MEASVTGAPAVTEQPVQPVEQPTQPEAPQTEQPSEGGNDVMQAITELRERVDQALKPEEETETPDLLTALEAEPETPPEAAGEQPGADQGVEGQEAQQQQLEDLRAFVRQEAQQLVSPLQQERREEQIRALPEKYPDITSKQVLPRLEQQMSQIVQLSGNEDLLTDHRVVEMAYKAVKAEMADAGAVPAEQAAQQGASLETHAGQTQVGSPSQDEDYKSAVYGQSPDSGVFRF